MPVYPTYTREFRADALNLVRKGEKSISEIARDLGVSHWVLRRWCKSDPMARRKKAAIDVAGGANETPEQRIARLERELDRLRKENESLKTDREILKKAAAFFAKESE
jgi:transposase